MDRSFELPHLVRYRISADGILLECPDGPVVPFVDVQQLLAMLTPVVTAGVALQALLESVGNPQPSHGMAPPCTEPAGHSPLRPFTSTMVIP